jgi:chromosome segregation ATPase
MDKKELDQRIAELNAERERLSGELDKARIEAREAMIAGKKPSGTAAALAERIAIVDDALAELQDRSRGAAESAERNNRRRRAEAALDATSKRAKLAATVDDALNALASSWDAYADALRKDVGQVSGAGGDLTAVERALTNNRAAEPLLKALIQSGGVKLARTLGIDTPIRERHAISLADAEARVAESLRVELLRIKASSPQPYVSREAQAELEKMEATR